MTTNAKKVATMTGADCYFVRVQEIAMTCHRLGSFAPCHAICPKKYSYYMHQYYDIPERKQIFLNFLNWVSETLVPEHDMMGDKSTELAKKSPHRNFLYELSKKNPPA